jgi:hypothetical protein
MRHLIWPSCRDAKGKLTVVGWWVQYPMLPFPSPAVLRPHIYGMPNTRLARLQDRIAEAEDLLLFGLARRTPPSKFVICDVDASPAFHAKTTDQTCFALLRMQLPPTTGSLLSHRTSPFWDAFGCWVLSTLFSFSGHVQIQHGSWPC